jgi:hypothetical protein
MATTEWVPVMAPPELAARFLREVADYLASGAGDDQFRLWEDATGTDVRAFLETLTETQYRLFVSLAMAKTPMSAAAHAERLKVSVDAIAGYVGPINKRAKKMAWAAPVRSHGFWNGKRMERVLMLDERLAGWVRDHHEEEGK